jgi:hypothetical protein
MHASASLGGKIANVFFQLCARYAWLVKHLVSLEKILCKSVCPQIEPEVRFDQILLLGLGYKDSEQEGDLTWWSLRNDISVVHIVGNYDNLTANGYRGVPVSRLLVWGPNMRKDAISIHGIESDRVAVIGSIRYNALNEKLRTGYLLPKEEFLSEIGLDPKKKTLLFAGFFFESHYFEMLECLKELNEAGYDFQLILRIYPNKMFMSSIYLEPLLCFSKSTKNVVVSLADPNYKSGEREKNVLQIEEHELWNGLNCCDCLINIYSTIAIEGCMFDKPTIYMGYFPDHPGNFVKRPIYYDYASNPHNRRLASYNAIEKASNRVELKNKIIEAISNPSRLTAERRHVVEDEIGIIDGNAHYRLVENCVEVIGVR